LDLVTFSRSHQGATPERQRRRVVRVHDELAPRLRRFLDRLEESAVA